MNGTIYTVVGVARPEFRGMTPAVTAQMVSVPLLSEYLLKTS